MSYIYVCVCECVDNAHHTLEYDTVVLCLIFLTEVWDSVLFNIKNARYTLTYLVQVCSVCFQDIYILSFPCFCVYIYVCERCVCVCVCVCW